MRSRSYGSWVKRRFPHSTLFGRRLGSHTGEKHCWDHIIGVIRRCDIIRLSILYATTKAEIWGEAQDALTDIVQPSEDPKVELFFSDDLTSLSSQRRLDLFINELWRNFKDDKPGRQPFSLRSEAILLLFVCLFCSWTFIITTLAFPGIALLFSLFME